MADEQSRGERPGFGPSGPFSTSDIHTVFTAVDIHKNLGQLEKAVKVLERVTDAQGEKIYQVTRQMDRMEHTQTILDEVMGDIESEKVQAALGTEEKARFTVGFSKSQTSSSS